MEDLSKIEIEVDEGKRSSAICDEASGDHGKMDGGLRDGAYVSGEELCSASGGSAELDIVMDGIKENIPRKALAEATSKDDTLQLIRQLASEGNQGYRVDQGIVMRDRMDDKGENVTQVCVPRVFRKKCLSLVHTRFGHQGRNKMLALLRPYFYWPGMAKDSIEYIKGCKTGGLGGSISHRHGWLQVFTNGYRPCHQMARGHPAQDHHLESG